jgi:uncharacterized RDD family membrane protein YckC
MSSMPEPDAAGQWSGGPQQNAHPGDSAGAPSQGGVPGHEQFGSSPYRGAGGQSPGGYGQPYGQWGSRPGNASPVHRDETRVTGRRVVQYLIDSFLVSLIPSLVSIPFDRSGSTIIHIVGGLVAFVLFVLIGLWYWVIRPHGHVGQTFGMQLLGLRVISKEGGPANLAQLFIRWVCLIFDAIPYTWPFTGLVGFIVILMSRNRQRIGDHLARTLVVSTGSAVKGRPQFEGTGADQTGMVPSDKAGSQAPDRMR